MSLKIKSPQDLYCNDQFSIKVEPLEKIKGKSGFEVKVGGGPMKKKRMPASLSISCPVCGGPAPDHVHFGGQCCYSCRAFFRRTSVKPISNFRCRSGKNDCLISSGTKSCIPCRLQKCLKVGMDPGLVRGKKLKRESIDEENSERTHLLKHENDDKATNMTSIPQLPKLTKLTSTSDQENLLKYRAEILKYQGMYLHYQASMVEQEAQKRLADEHSQYAFVPTIQYSTSEYAYHHEDRSRHMLTPSPAYDEPRYDVEYKYDSSAMEATEADTNDQNDEDQPLDLSVKSSHVTNLHTQSSEMPRIFFSRIPQ